MKKDVFITGLASFFPNSPVSNNLIYMERKYIMFLF